MKLQILIPQYKEPEAVIRPLLDSIAIQQNVDLENEVGVIIVNDGSDVILHKDFLRGYPFRIQYILAPHRGVSAARNTALDAATAEYVMWCDADDLMYNACGLWIIFREIKLGEFDGMRSLFIEEVRRPDNGEVVYINRENDSTFVHGKVWRREYLIENKIRWNEDLTIHEDSYFNSLALNLSDNIKDCPYPFYLWRWRDDSVCRHDPKYILKTYTNMLDSNTALVDEFIRRERVQDAQFFCVSMIYDAYFNMNKAEWLNQENQSYRHSTEARFSRYYRRFEQLFLSIPAEVKAQIIMGIKNRMYGEGLLMESITFDDWIRHIKQKF